MNTEKTEKTERSNTVTTEEQLEQVSGGFEISTPEEPTDQVFIDNQGSFDHFKDISK